MLLYTTISLFCAMFIELFLAFNIQRDLISLFDKTKDSVASLRSNKIGDLEKEILARKSSVEIFKFSCYFFIKFIIIILIIIFICLIIYIVSPEFALFITKNLKSFYLILFSILFSMGYYFLRKTFGNRYNIIEKLLHYFAFSFPFLPQILSELEDDIFNSKINEINSNNEIFISGLPRSGTTLILEILYDTGEFITYTYRNMPFILSPILWNSISKLFKRKNRMIERAHKDGMRISFDSPEAFEEYVWISRFKKVLVKDDSVEPLKPDDLSAEDVRSIKKSVNKIILANKTHTNDCCRYLSKNNSNFSRIKVIKKIFPTAVIIIPFRHPLTHVRSLINQHKNFIELHKNDKFSRRYMEWIGHYDFGLNFRPINCDKWLNKMKFINFYDESFWLRYWTASYTHILNNISKNVYLVDFEKLIKNGEYSLGLIADRLKIKNKERLLKATERFRKPSSKPILVTKIPKDLLDNSFELYKQLKKLSIQGTGF